MSEKIQKNIMTAVIASETIHIFCCVLPTVFSVISLLSGMGLIVTMPGFIDAAHHMIHDYEIPLMMISAAILLAGWGLYFYAQRLNCRTEAGCAHEPCAPKKNRVCYVLMGASILFMVNVIIYVSLHAPMDAHVYEAEAAQQ